MNALYLTMYKYVFEWPSRELNISSERNREKKFLLWYTYKGDIALDTFGKVDAWVTSENN